MKTSFRRLSVRAVGLMVLASAPMWASAQAQDYPRQAIRLVVPFPPGGGVDGAAHILSAHLGARLGQSVFIDNRSGASGNIGTQVVAQAKPDGYTLLMASLSPNAINPHLYKKLGYDPIHDFTPIGLAITIPQILVVNPSSDYRSVADLVARAKAKPGALNYGSSGVGSTQHLATESFQQRTGTAVTHVLYRGSAPQQAALMAGEIDFIIDSSSVLNLVTAGKLRVLAVTSKERLPVLPDVPTLDEAGVQGVEAGVWYGLMAPGRTPTAIVERVSQALKATLPLPDVQGRVRQFGGQTASGSPPDMAARIRSDIVK